MEIEPIPDDCLPPQQVTNELLRGPKTRYVVYCVEPGCHCDHRSGFVIENPADWDRPGYEVREEICGGGTYHGMTPAEVIEDRDAYRRIVGD